MMADKESAYMIATGGPSASPLILATRLDQRFLLWLNRLSFEAGESPGDLALKEK